MNIKYMFLASIVLAATFSFAQEATEPAPSIFIPEPNQVAQPADSTADTTAQATPVDSTALPAVIPEDSSMLAKKNPAPDTAKVEPKVVQEVAKVDSAQTDSAALPPKRRGKIYVADYKARQKATHDSILAVNFRHGITIQGARYFDKRYGKAIDAESNWGGGAGIYYSYRRYFVDVIGIQARAGLIYRYARFDEVMDEDQGKLQSGLTYDLSRSVELTYDNFAFDVPLTFKIGKFIEPTTFLHFNLTFGITKPLFEYVYSENKLFFNNPSPELSKTLDILDKEGKNPYPVKEQHEIDKTFFMDDWETNGWVGVGIDGKYASITAQALVASGSTTMSNHRYYNIFRANAPTWRIMVDLSLR